MPRTRNSPDPAGLLAAAPWVPSDSLPEPGAFVFPSVTHLDNALLAKAVGHIRATDALTVAQQIRLTQVPAPPFMEETRGTLMADLLREAGLSQVWTDEVGNVLGRCPGADDALPPVVVCAHLDTVFPQGTPVTVREEGDTLVGPGISDNGRGLTVLLALVRALAAGDVPLRHPVLFAASVGEEGLGDLRGVRHMVAEGGAAHGAAAFIAVDGAGLGQVVNQGLGSRRYRLEVRGPGGHSWLDRGTVNPIHALSGFATGFRMPEVPPDQDASFSCGRCEGGSSVNAIPESAWVEVDCRSTSPDHLEEMAAEVTRAARSAVAAEDAAGKGTLALEIHTIGFRPAGFTDPRSAVVHAARLATDAVGVIPTLGLASTDANAAMAAGIPAVTIGGGGDAGLAHTTREWYRNAQGADGVIRALYTVCLTAGIAS